MKRSDLKTKIKQENNYKSNHNQDNVCSHLKSSDGLNVCLPAIALKYLGDLSTTLKRSTCYSHRIGLKHLYLFSKIRKISVEKMQRIHFQKFLKYLVQAGLSPAVRRGKIMQIRMYLRWLSDGRYIIDDPYLLLKSSDLPKQPHYLPRPLPMEVDQEIQRRLASSDDVYSRALLLLRKTGMRAGEVLSLSYDCLQQIGNGNFSLKVPAGKLNKERMIPIDTDTRELVVALKSQCDSYWPFKRNTLICTPSGRQMHYTSFRQAFSRIIHGIETEQPIVLHRLRHTYATNLLNAGISLIALRDILGHHDIKMTLKYAEITQKTIRDEYYRAMKIISSQLDFGQKHLIECEGYDNSSQSIREPFLIVEKYIKDDNQINKKKRKTLLYRLKRLQSDICKRYPGITLSQHDGYDHAHL